MNFLIILNLILFQPITVHGEPILFNSLEDRTQIDRKPFVDVKRKMVHFTFDNLFTHLVDEKKWKFSEESTHGFLKKMGGVTREKLHIQGKTKRNVYSVSSINFEDEDLVHEKIEFSNERKDVF